MKKIPLLILIVLTILILSSLSVIAQNAVLQIPENQGIVLLYSMEDCLDMRTCAQKEHEDYAMKGQTMEVKPGKYLVVSDYEKQEVELSAGETKLIELTVKPIVQSNEITGAITSPIIDGTSIGIGLIILLSFAVMIAQVVSYKTHQNRQDRFESYLNQYSKMKKRK